MVLRGTCRVMIEREKLDLRPGQFVIIPPDACHTSATIKGPVFRACVHFDWMGSGFSSGHPVCSYHPQRPHRNRVALRPGFVPAGLLAGSFAINGPVPVLLEKMFPRWQTEESLQQGLCRGHFLELLIHLLWPAERRKTAGSRALRLAHAAKEILDRQGETAPSVRALLASLGFSYPHICRIFNKSFGITPVEYLNARRLERAKELLAHRSLTISEIAYTVGFRDPGYFTRRFTRQNGMSPKVYREGCL